MKFRFPHLSILSSALAALLIPGHAPSQPTDSVPAAEESKLPEELRNFQLDGPQLYKAGRRSRDLLVNDFNGDGKLDFATINNEKSTLEVYHRKEGKDASDLAFESVTYPLDRVVRSAVAVDVDGDGRTDVALAGSPSRLAIMYQDESGRLQSARNTAILADRLALGEITGADSPDLVVLHDGRMSILPAAKRGIELEPAQHWFTTGAPAGDIMLIDVDGDDRRDVVYHDADKFEDLVFRLQSPEGTFPSEFRVSRGVLRSVVPLPAANGRAGSLATVLNSTRSLAQLQLNEEDNKDESTLKLSPLQTLPFAKENRSRRTFTTIADVDGDGRQDLIVTSPELSTVRVLRQSRTGALTETSYPSLSGVEAILPLQGAKGSADALLFFSPEEKVLAVSTYDAKAETLPFPRVLPASGQPLGAALVTVKAERLLATLLKEDKKSRLAAWPLSGDLQLGEQKVLFPELPEAVKGIEPLDANRDGLTDLVIYIDFKPAIILLQGKGGEFTQLTATSAVFEGLLSGTRPGLIKGVRLSPDEESLLVVKEKFARASHVAENGDVLIDQQFQGRDSTSRLADAAVGAVSAKGSIDVVLLDRGNKIATVYPVGEAGKLGEAVHFNLDDAVYNQVATLDLDGDSRQDIVLVADDRLSILTTRPFTFNLESLATASTPIEDGGYGRAYSGSLVNNRGPVVLAIEMKENVLEFFLPSLDEDKAPTLLPFYRFRVFDSEATIARQVNLDAQPEPREIVFEDIDGDGMIDLLCLTHDNVLIYRQTKR